MPIKTYKPITPGRRSMTKAIEPMLSKIPKGSKSLFLDIKKSKGRSKGRVSTRHKGGGAKKKLRIIDFGQEKIGTPGVVESLEYDPYRSSYIALIKYRDGDRRYILAHQGIKLGDEITCSLGASIKPGNRIMLRNIPVGFEVFNAEMLPGKGGQLARSAGSYIKLLAVEGGYATVELRSREVRKIKDSCFATLGRASNPDRAAEVIGKAGRQRHKGIRPTVRGSAMNPVDHPHGGGEGRAPIGMPGPKTPWGKPARGVKTRKKHKYSNKFILKRRKGAR